MRVNVYITYLGETGRLKAAFTRVPCVGEWIASKNEMWKVISVRHEDLSKPNPEIEAYITVTNANSKR